MPTRRARAEFALAWDRRLPDPERRRAARAAAADDERQLSHVWMVRAFQKHSEEAEENKKLCEVHRARYDYCWLWGPLNAGVAEIERLLGASSTAVSAVGDEEDWRE